VNRAEFETVVAEALDELPPQYGEKLENVAVVVEDEAGDELMRQLGLRPRRDTLFGLYQGVPLDERGFAFGNALPDRITLFYLPLRRAGRTPDGIRREIRRTLIHEIGHHFGLDDPTMRKDGY
jgi:predicted Zn-dependent protease with MMP-like domain